MADEASESGSKRQALLDQRRSRRYDLNLPVDIRSEFDTVPASSRDISTTGIYLKIPRNFQLSSQLEFDVQLPPALANGKEGRVRCSAKIVRVDRTDESPTVGVAAEIISYKFLQVG